jgi:hypothetical protein
VEGRKEGKKEGKKEGRKERRHFSFSYCCSHSHIVLPVLLVLFSSRFWLQGFVL